LIRDWSGLTHSFSNALIDDFRSPPLSYGETLKSGVVLKLLTYESNFLNNSIRKRLWRLNFYFKFKPSFVLASVNSVLFINNVSGYKKLIWFLKTPSISVPYFFSQNRNLLTKLPLSLYVLKGSLRVFYATIGKLSLLFADYHLLRKFPVVEFNKVLLPHSGFKYLRTVLSKPHLVSFLLDPRTFPNPVTYNLYPLINAKVLPKLLRFKHTSLNKILNTPQLAPPFDPIYLKVLPKDRAVNLLKVVNPSLNPLLSYYSFIYFISVCMYSQFYKSLSLHVLSIVV
jgi:hypothetical protein